MSETIDPRAQGEAFLASYDALVTRNRLLETENTALTDQVDAVMGENDRLHERVQQLTGRLDAALHRSNATEHLLNDIASKFLAGLKVLYPVNELRGAPARNDEALPKIVRMGPA